MSWSRTASLVAGASALLLATALPATAATGHLYTALAHNSKGWRYHRTPSTTADKDFYKPGFNASSWKKGQEGFGDDTGECSWNNPSQVKTIWNVATDLLVRPPVTLPAHAKSVHVYGTIDNDAHVYFNGHLVQYV